MSDLKVLRSRLRETRRALSATEQRHHAHRIARLLRTSLPLQRSKRIAFYLSEDGEVDLLSAMNWALRSRKTIFLPVLRAPPQGALWLCELRPGDKLNRNRFGIEEPNHRRREPVDPWGLDLVFVPLVGFDDQGNRLGMGGGFYDRTFAYRRTRRFWKKPKLVGVAHECQKVGRLAQRPWDVPIDGVVTENRVYWFSPPRR